MNVSVFLHLGLSPPSTLETRSRPPSVLARQALESGGLRVSQDSETERCKCCSWLVWCGSWRGDLAGGSADEACRLAVTLELHPRGPALLESLIVWRSADTSEGYSSGSRS